METRSSSESLISRNDNTKSPESSDWEGYATPLATSMSELPTSNSLAVTIDVSESEPVESVIDSRELTPVGNCRAESPIVVKNVIFLEKPNILKMTEKIVEVDCDDVKKSNELKFESADEDSHFEIEGDENEHVEQIEETANVEVTVEVEEDIADSNESDAVCEEEEEEEVKTENDEEVHVNGDLSIESVTSSQTQANDVKIDEDLEIIEDADVLNINNVEEVSTDEIFEKKREFEAGTEITIKSTITEDVVMDIKIAEKEQIIDAQSADNTEKDDSNPIQQLAQNSIERYPDIENYKESADEEDDSEKSLVVQQISAEFEQLVAAINAFGKEEKHKKDNSEVPAEEMTELMEVVETNKKANENEVCDQGVSSNDQIIQTDNDDSLILVDRIVPEIMESLQIENDRLRRQLENLTMCEIEDLKKESAKLQAQLKEANHTIDEIEVEAEQQYTEMTSEIDELCEVVMKKDEDLALLKEKVINLTNNEVQLREDIDAQRAISQRQKQIIEGIREELDTTSKKLAEMTRLRDKAVEEANIQKQKNQDKDRFLAQEAQMSMEIEDLQRELNKQKLILNNTSMSKLADTFDRKVLRLENELRERDMLICKQNQIINSHRKSPTGTSLGIVKKTGRASAVAAENLPSAGSSSESFQNGLDHEAKDIILRFILSDRHQQMANLYSIGRTLDLNPQEERQLERYLTKDSKLEQKPC